MQHCNAIQNAMEATQPALREEEERAEAFEQLRINALGQRGELK